MSDFLEFITSQEFWHIVGTVGVYFFVVPAFVIVLISGFIGSSDSKEEDQDTWFK